MLGLTPGFRVLCPPLPFSFFRFSSLPCSINHGLWWLQTQKMFNHGWWWLQTKKTFEVERLEEADSLPYLFPEVSSHFHLLLFRFQHPPDRWILLRLLQGVRRWRKDGILSECREIPTISVELAESGFKNHCLSTIWI